MKLGFFTACLPDVPLGNLAAWAVEAGFEALEVAAWPHSGERGHTATHLDVASFTQRDSDAVRRMLGLHGVTLSAIGLLAGLFGVPPVTLSRSPAPQMPYL